MNQYIQLGLGSDLVKFHMGGSNFLLGYAMIAKCLKGNPMKKPHESSSTQITWGVSHIENKVPSHTYVSGIDDSYADDTDDDVRTKWIAPREI